MADTYQGRRWRVPCFRGRDADRIDSRVHCADCPCVGDSVWRAGPYGAREQCFGPRPGFRVSGSRPSVSGFTSAWRDAGAGCYVDGQRVGKMTGLMANHTTVSPPKARRVLLSDLDDRLQGALQEGKRIVLLTARRVPEKVGFALVVLTLNPEDGAIGLWEAILQSFDRY